MVALDALLGAIENFEYTPEVVSAPERDRGGSSIARIELPGLPEELRSLFLRAAEENKLVLLRFSGPG